MPSFWEVPEVGVVATVLAIAGLSAEEDEETSVVVRFAGLEREGEEDAGVLDEASMIRGFSEAVGSGYS